MKLDTKACHRYRAQDQYSHGAQDMVDAAESPVQLRAHRGLQQAQAAAAAAVIIMQGQHKGVVALKQLFLVVCNLQGQQQTCVSA